MKGFLVASDEAIKKMIHSIMEKRKELGILDWGQAKKGEVMRALNQDPQSKTGAKQSSNLEKDDNHRQNNKP